MDMQQHQHHSTPMTQIVSVVKKGEEKLEHKLGISKEKEKLEKDINLVGKKIDETALPLEEHIVDKILADQNTEKLIEYIINSPKTKKIVKDIANEDLQELKKELVQQIKKLEDNYSDDFKHLTHGLIYFALGAAIALKVITLYS